MQFKDFAHQLQTLEDISSRLTMTQELAKLYQALEPAEITPVSYLLLGQLRPAYEGTEFQIAIKTVIKALARIWAQSEESGAGPKSDTLFGDQDFSAAESYMTKWYQKLGDVGSAAQELKEKVGDKGSGKLSIVQVYERLLQLASEHGEGSQERKLHGLTELLTELDALSAKFVCRIVLARLRLGFSTMTMIDALSWAVHGTKQDNGVLEDAFQKKADIGKLAHTYLTHTTPEAKLKALADYNLEIGIPVVPALCQRLNSSQEIIDKMHHVIAEPKYDGLRVQIHVDKTVTPPLIRTFTRNLEESSEMFPELQTIANTLNCKSCILDAEAIGYDRETGKLLPFQETIQRKRKHGVEAAAEERPVRCYVFDVLAVDNKPLISQPLRERKDVLKQLFKQNEVLHHSPFIETSDPEELREFHETQLAEGLEGAVIKQIDSNYQSGRKGWQWVKIKEEEGSRGKLKDTLDCVVMGYYFGRGKRTSFGLGAFLVGVLDPDQKLKTLAKIGTGLSDEQFRELKQRCESLVVPDQPPVYEVTKALLPDVWVQPSLVVEIAADEITKSPVHSAEVALRFPRLVRFRDDKDWAGATTLEEVTQLQKLQYVTSKSE